jgi:hypothetical protein
MLAKVHERIYVGDFHGCSYHFPRLSGVDTPHATIHACKDPCHKLAVKYERTLPPEHPQYLVKENARDLYLNMIDPAQPLFRLELFWAASLFIDKHIATEPVVIHCTQGLSRSPSLFLVYGASRGILPTDYVDATVALRKLYPDFTPGQGIALYTRTHWEELLDARPDVPAPAQ